VVGEVCCRASWQQHVKGLECAWKLSAKAKPPRGRHSGVVLAGGFAAFRGGARPRQYLRVWLHVPELLT